MSEQELKRPRPQKPVPPAEDDEDMRVPVSNNPLDDVESEWGAP